LTVSELIEQLRTFPQDAIVELSNGEGLARYGVTEITVEDGAVVLG
jgi:hypothetical protein